MLSLKFDVLLKKDLFKSVPFFSSWNSVVTLENTVNDLNEKQKGLKYCYFLTAGVPGDSPVYPMETLSSSISLVTNILQALTANRKQEVNKLDGLRNAVRQKLTESIKSLSTKTGRAEETKQSKDEAVWHLLIKRWKSQLWCTNDGNISTKYSRKSSNTLRKKTPLRRCWRSSGDKLQEVIQVWL